LTAALLNAAMIRERVFVEVERLRTVVDPLLRGEGSNRFTWVDEELWVDRSRCLVLDAGKARTFGCYDSDRVPNERESEIEYRGCRFSSADAWRMVDLLACFALGRSFRKQVYVDDFVTFTVLQPRVNPAFGPLFWLALDAELDWTARAAERTLSTMIGPMAYDLSRYPASLSEAPSVRDAQLDFVQKYVEPGLASKWKYASDAEWAEHCDELLYANKAPYLFALVEQAVQRES
jgi:hypothetical protein